MYSIYISYRSFYRFVSLFLSSPWEKLSVLLVLSEDQKDNYFGNSIYGHLFLKFSYNLNNMMVIYLMWIVFLVATAGRVWMRDFHQYICHTNGDFQKCFQRIGTQALSPSLWCMFYYIKSIISGVDNLITTIGFLSWALLVEV